MLPLVYLGLCRDFWLSLSAIWNLKKKWAARSTFFLIPLKIGWGKKSPGKDAKRRAAKYDIMDIQDSVKKLVDKGLKSVYTVLMPGMTQPLPVRKRPGYTEYKRKTDVGIRIHWLCFGKHLSDT